MCKAMNRSIWNVLFGGFGLTKEGAPAPATEIPGGGAVKSYSVEDAVTIMENSSSVVFVPGYGMAAARAQHQGHAGDDPEKFHAVRIERQPNAAPQGPQDAQQVDGML
ncbi:MAG: NAD(P)(+) transhydrogenase (Re/Si-specific) subunit beta [bacterium]